MLRRLIAKRGTLTRLLNHGRVVASQPSTRPTDLLPSPSFTHSASVTTVEKPSFASGVRSFGSALKPEEAEGEGDDTESVQPEADAFLRRMHRYIYTSSAERVLGVLEEMKAESVPLDTRFYTAVMKAYSRQGDVSKVAALFEELLANGISPDKFVFNTYIYAFASSGDISAARETFRRMEEEFGVVPDSVTYRSLMSVCGRGKQLEQAKELFKDLQQRFPEPDLRNYNTLIDCYADCVDAASVEGDLQECRDLVAGLKEVGLQPDGHTYAHLVKLCGRGGLIPEALRLLNEALNRNLPSRLVAFDAVICGMNQNEMTDEECREQLVTVFKSIKAHGHKPSRVTYANVIDLFAKRGDLEQMLSFIDALNSANLGRGGSGYGARMMCIERLGTSGALTPEQCLERLAEVLSQLKPTGVSLSYDGYMAWLRICAMSHNLEKAFECWNAFATLGRKPFPEMVQVMVELVLYHDRVEEAVKILDVALDKELALTPEMFEPILAHLSQKQDREIAQGVYDRMQRANVTPTAEMAKFLSAPEQV